MALDSTKPSFHILICLIQIWEPTDENDPMSTPKNMKMITEVENIEISDSFKKTIGSASVKFPRGTVLKRTITEIDNAKYANKITANIEDNGVLITTRVDSKKAEVADFKVGQRIRIYLGLTTDPKVAALAKRGADGLSIHNDDSKLATYKDNLEKMFDGYITKCSIDTPIELQCENLASKLKKISCPNIPDNGKNRTVNDIFGPKGILSEQLKKSGLSLHPKTQNCEINIGSIGLNSHLSIADVFAEWAKRKLYSFVKEYDGKPCIAVGWSYSSNAKDDSVMNFDDNSSSTEILFDYHVASNDLSLTVTDKNFLAVEAKSLGKDGKFYHVTIVRNPDWDSSKPASDRYRLLNEVSLTKKQMQAGATVLSKGKDNKHVDLSTYTIIPYTSRKIGIDHKALVEEAKKYFESYQMTGIEGSLTLFGDLHLKSPVKVRLVDNRYPQKNGDYLVDEVITKFGTKGYRQTIKLPYCINREKQDSKQ